MVNKSVENDRYININIEQIYLLHILLVWGGYLTGDQIE